MKTELFCLRVVISIEIKRRSHFRTDWLEEREKVLHHDALNIDFPVLTTLIDLP